MIELHHCSIPGCDREIFGDRLMCQPHWKILPTTLQRRVSDAWRRFRHSGDVARLSAYEKERTEAIRYVVDHEDVDAWLRN